MNVDFFVENRLSPVTLIPQIFKEWQSYYEYKAFKEYYPQFHKVNDQTIRRKKEVKKEADYKDANGNPVINTEYIEVNRIALALQKLIVSRKTAFTTGGAVNLQCKPVSQTDTRLNDAVNLVWRNNKLQFKNSELFKKLASETEVAEIWFSKVREDNTVELRVNLYSPEQGYKLIPLFDDESRDLIAFGVAYKTRSGNKDIDRLDLYDKDTKTKYIKSSGQEWIIEEEIPLLYGKIPVIYYKITQSVWQDVQSMIERLEVLISNFGDTNDYNGSPILFAEGDIEGWADKGETGKVIMGKDGAKLSYVNWDQAPESIKLEIETLTNMIYTITQTPDISFKAMQGLGDISGVAFDRIMIDAHLNAKDYHNGIYGEGIQRRINFLKSALCAIDSTLKPSIDLEITPKFSLFSVDDERDRIDNALAANGGLPIMSQLESIKYAGLSEDAEQTLNEISNNVNTQ